MTKILSLFKFIIVEVIIICLFLLTVSIYFGKPANNIRTITGDGAGYYDYLPSIFIYHDVDRNHFSQQEKDAFQKRVGKFGFYLNYKGNTVDRYPCGTALLMSPFFFYTLWVTDLQGTYEDGYQLPFHLAIYYAALFYLFFSLVFLRKLLEQYKIRRSTIVFSQVLLVFATGVTQYASSNAAFSHVYSLFAVTAFLFFAKKFFDHKSLQSFLWACVFLGLITILRQINILIIFFVPFLAGTFDNLRDRILYIFRKPAFLFTGMTLFALIVLIQLLLWYLQTGEFFLYSYQGDRFYWLHPKFIKILFSYRKGLFVYTPVLFFGLVGVFHMIFKKRYYCAASWGIFFVVITYFLSAWQWWYYGGSYGLRAYIDFYAVFFIPFAWSLDQLKRWWGIALGSIILLTIPLNLIQTYQFQRYILHATNMTKEKYWKVFLKTDERFEGILWQRNYDFSKYHVAFKDTISEIAFPPNTDRVIWKILGSKIKDFGSVSVVHVSFDNDFKEDNDTRLVLRIKGANGKLNYYYRPYIIQFAKGKFGQFQTGTYNYEFPPVKRPEEQTITFELSTGKEGARLKNFKFEFLVQNSF